ncbi:hypothetical protein PSV08DRAFT_13171 [Bipolaris maydis]|nr:hypothetical protein PSV08DRAFT_12796 [Bipolaris maydis]KAJ6267602.1 hypothetical protein PSV08DRAFT_13171 [Bipolaris maydis]
MPKCCAAYSQDRTDVMEERTIPKRVVLRFQVTYELEESAINKSFFSQISYELGNDYYSHLMAANNSSKMHIVLDLHCNTNPTIDKAKIPYEVYKVSKKDGKFEFEQLHGKACNLARERCKRVGWGTHRTQSDELDGVLASHVGHLPPTFVS